jgi:hypothetical protein
MIKKYFKINRRNIAIVQFIIEGYEGMATVSTIDPHTAIIKISIMPDFISEFSGLIDDLKNKYKIVEINPATWNPSAPDGEGKRRDPREVALSSTSRDNSTCKLQRQ